MKVYVNCITSGAELRNDIKALIPEMNVRRRMGRVVKSGVAAGVESLLAFGDRVPVDAVVTATGLGCIADSEKFLDALIANEETMLNPTPFIQSTFNTVGAQIALLRGLHCYNTTYAHRWTSFENALVDAALRIGAGLSRAVLVGAFDETTPSVEKVLQRLGVAQENTWGESSVFFVLTAEAFDTTVAAITGIRFPDGTANSGTGGHPADGGTADRDPEDMGDVAEARTAGRNPIGRIMTGGNFGTKILSGDGSDTEFPAGESSDRSTAAGNGTGSMPGCGAAANKEPADREALDMSAATGKEPENAPEGGKYRTIRASESGVAPHFTAIAEVFRRLVAGEGSGRSREAENAGEVGGTGNAENTEKTGDTENIGNAANTGNAGQRIVLYNDFPGKVISAIELTCM